MAEDRRFEIELANELINLANDKQAAGADPTAIAAAYRHAAQQTLPHMPMPKAPTNDSPPSA